MKAERGRLHLFVPVSQAFHILIACGGTGGHLFPGIAVAEALRERGHEVCLLISEKQVDAQASAKYGHLRFETLPAVAKPPTLSPRMLPFLWRTWCSIRRCKLLLRELRSDAVLGMGGFTSLPPVVAGHRMGLKTFVHDSNARPGRANVLTSRFCTRVLLGLEAAKPFFRKPCEITGTPVRPEILALPERAQAAARYGLDPARPTLLITGGSQGARRLNEICAEAATLLPAELQVLHIAGALDEERVRQLSTGRAGHQVLGFCDQMASAYAASDLVVARSGASSLTEIGCAGLPSILVPFPYAADDHQTRNAQVARDAGAALMVAEADLDAARLAQHVAKLMADLPARQRMGAAARTLARPDAAQRVCDAIETTLKPA